MHTLEHTDRQTDVHVYILYKIQIQGARDTCTGYQYSANFHASHLIKCFAQFHKHLSKKPQ